jgi:hypothetical protein
MEEGTLAAEEEPMERLLPMDVLEGSDDACGLAAMADVAMAADELLRAEIDVMRILRVGAFASCVGVQNDKGEAHLPAVVPCWQADHGADS